MNNLVMLYHILNSIIENYRTYFIWYLCIFKKRYQK